MIPYGARVQFHYTLMVDGWVVDTSNGRTPLAYVHGTGEILPGLEEELAAMDRGEHRQFHVPPEKGYGMRNPEAITKVRKDRFEGADGLTIGAVVGGSIAGYRFQGVVTDVDEENVTLDLNHPLAGKRLEFEIEVVDVDPPPASA